jgi:hypothetical protein
MAEKIQPKNNQSNQSNANKGTSGTNKQYSQNQGNRGAQLNPNQKNGGGARELEVVNKSTKAQIKNINTH